MTPSSLDDFLAIPDEHRFHELLGNQILAKARPSGEHGGAQAAVVSATRPPYHRRRLADRHQRSTLTVMRWAEAGYTTVLRAERGETVRPEPFEAIELSVGTLFGDDPPE